LEIRGAEKPNLRSLFVVSVVLFPYRLVLAIYYSLRWVIFYRIMGYSAPQLDTETQYREQMGMSEAEWEKYKRQAEERMERIKSSGKYKRMRRMMKHR